MKGRFYIKYSRGEVTGWRSGVYLVFANRPAMELHLSAPVTIENAKSHPTAVTLTARKSPVSPQRGPSLSMGINLDP